MRRIWIPGPIYRLFPWASVGAGVFFCIFVQNVASLALCCGLVGYGLMVAASRAAWR